MGERRVFENGGWSVTLGDDGGYLLEDAEMERSFGWPKTDAFWHFTEADELG